MNRRHLVVGLPGRSRRTVAPARTATLAAAAVLLASCGSASADPETAAQAPALPKPSVEAAAPADSPTGEATTAPGDGPPAPSAATATLRQTLVGSAPVRYDPAAVSGTTLDGEQVVASDLDGPVVYWFWAPWCTVCRVEAPAVAQVAADFAGEVTFVGVASRGPQQDMEAFVTETETTGITHIADLDGTIWAQFGVSAQPAFVFVDREGSATGWLGGLGEPLLAEVAASLAG